MELGYLSPSGEMYVCKPFEHLSLAKDLCTKLGFLEDISNLNKHYSSVDCENYLLAKGFVAIYSRSMTHICCSTIQIGAKCFPHKQLSKIQEEFIKSNLKDAFNTQQLDAICFLLDCNDNFKD